MGNKWSQQGSDLKDSGISSHIPDGKVEDTFENENIKNKIKPRSYLESSSYTWKLKGICTVTVCQTVFGDMKSVKNWSVFPELTPQQL